MVVKILKWWEKIKWMIYKEEAIFRHLADNKRRRPEKLMMTLRYRWKFCVYFNFFPFLINNSNIDFVSFLFSLIVMRMMLTGKSFNGNGKAV